jgi:hypothetical protein
MEEALKPKCKLTATDGNVFALAGRVSRALTKAHQPAQAAEMHARLWQCGSYEEALQLFMEYVNVQ